MWRSSIGRAEVNGSRSVKLLDLFLRLSLVSDLGREARVAVDRVRDLLQPGVGKQDLVGPLRLIPVAAFLRAEVGQSFLHGVFERVLGFSLK